MQSWAATKRHRVTKKEQKDKKHTGKLFIGTVMQIEKALVNDHLRVSKVS